MYRTEKYYRTDEVTDAINPRFVPVETIDFLEYVITMLGKSPRSILSRSRSRLEHTIRETAPKTNEEIVQKMEIRALKNDPQVIYNLGICYDKGSNGLPVDKVKALHYWTRAAELGNSHALTNIGVHYDDGKEVPVNRRKAALFYRAGALSGDLQGRHNIGAVEYFDFGNHQLGIHHYKIAAEAGSQPSLNQLRGIFNANGKMPGKEFICKEDLDNLYRGCHKAQMEVKSELREKHFVREDILNVSWSKLESY